jgi:hypothetical protein
MNLVEFIDCKFQELRLAEQADTKANKYSILRDSETLALQAVLKAFRVVTKWVFIPKVLVHYVLAVTGAVKRPEPVLLRKLEENQKKDQKDREAKAKKIGMLEMVQKQDESKEPSPA